MAAASERIITALGRRAALDPEALACLRHVREHLDGQVAAAVVSLRAYEYSDSEIGAALAVTKQAVSARFPRQDALSPDRGSR